MNIFENNNSYLDYLKLINLKNHFKLYFHLNILKISKCIDNCICINTCIKPLIYILGSLNPINKIKLMISKILIALNLIRSL